MEYEPDPMFERVWDEACTWNKKLLRQLGQPFGNLGYVDMKDINKLNKPAVSDIVARSIRFVENLMDNFKDLKTVNSSLQN
jgi:hypothetical protein